MRATLFSLLLVLSACASSHSSGRVVHPVPSSDGASLAVVAPDDVPPEGPEWALRTGRWDGPSPLQRPEVVWSISLAGPVIHPLTTDGRIIYAVAGGNVYALTTTGEKRWTARVQASGPAVVGATGLLVPQAAGSVALLSHESGEVLQQTESYGTAHAAPAFLDGVFVWVTAEGRLVSSSDLQHQISATPVSDLASDGQKVYIGTHGAELLAADLAGVVWTASLPGPAVGHPVVGAKLVYITTAPRGDTPAGVSAVRRDDGTRVWTSSISSAAGASPALGDVLVVPGLSGDLFAMDRDHGGIRWKAPGTAAFSVQPIIATETVYAGNADGRLYRLDIHDGGEAWSVDVGAPITGDPVLVQGRILLGLTDGRVVCLQ